MAVVVVEGDIYISTVYLFFFFLSLRVGRSFPAEGGGIVEVVHLPPFTHIHLLLYTWCRECLHPRSPPHTSQKGINKMRWNFQQCVCVCVRGRKKEGRSRERGLFLLLLLYIFIRLLLLLCIYKRWKFKREEVSEHRGWEEVQPREVNSRISRRSKTTSSGCLAR